jgi:hypothetical protein
MATILPDGKVPQALTARNEYGNKGESHLTNVAVIKDEDNQAPGCFGIKSDQGYFAIQILFSDDDNNGVWIIEKSFNDLAALETWWN